jgi:hypothetical protein
MQSPRNRLEALLLNGLLALDAQSEVAGKIAAQSRLHKEEKIPRIAALLEEELLRVTAIGLVGGILSSHYVSPASVELDPGDSREQLAFLIQQALPVGPCRSSRHSFWTPSVGFKDFMDRGRYCQPAESSNA